MPTVRRLVNADDIAFSTGLGGVDGITFGTIAVLFRPVADPVWHWLVKLHDISGVELGGVGVLSDSRIYWAGASIWWTEGPAVTFGDWHVLVARKNTGDLKPRFSLKNVTTGIWVHADGTEAQLDWVAPTGGSIRTKDATSGEGPNADYGAAAIWANELPWAADTTGDAAIEAANLDEHLDFWRDADPASGWAFDSTNVNINVEDFTLNRADETSSGVGSAVSATDLDFVFETTGILSLSRNFLRTTQTEPGATGIIRDLSETQGTPTTLGSGNVSGGFVEVLRWHRVVGTTVGSDSISTQVDVSAVSASTLEYRWQVQRYNSSGVLQASSDFSAGHNTVGIKTSTFVLSTTWAADDRLALSLQLRKASGGGSRNITLNVNDADAWVEFEVAETPAISGGLAVTETADTLVGSGTAVPPPITGTLAVTEASDTLAASGAAAGPGSTGTLAAAEADDTLAAAGTVTAPDITGTLAVTEASDTLAGSGTHTAPGVSGSLVVTEAADTLAASGGSAPPEITGALATVEAGDTLSASGVSSGPGETTGTISVTEAADVLVASGDVELPAVTGTLSVTEVGDTLAASGGAVAGITGTLTVTEASDTLAGVGGVQVPPVTGTLSVTEAADVLVAVSQDPLRRGMAGMVAQQVPTSMMVVARVPGGGT
jgi:hypothetical protein